MGTLFLWKGVYYALVLTSEILRKFQNARQRQSNGECPLGVLYTSLSYTGEPMVYPHRWNYRCSEVLYIHIGVGLRRCSFRLRWARGKASECEASDRIGLRAFSFYEP